MTKIFFSDVPITNKKYKSLFIESFNNLLDQGKFIQGDQVFKFENKLKKFTGAKYATSVASGTDALIVSLMAIGIKPGDEIITTPFTWLSTTQAIIMLGAIPRFVDVDQNSLLIDENLIEKKINKNTKAILVVSLFGSMNNFKKLNKIKKKYGIFLVEDAAQSFGSVYKNYNSCNIADISCTSFFPTKTLGGLGDGGAIFTNKLKFYENAKMIKLNGQIKKNRASMIGYNARIDTLQAAFLNKKINTIKSYIERKREVAKFYIENINNNSKCKIVAQDHSQYSCCSSFNIMVIKRDKLINHLKKIK